MNAAEHIHRRGAEDAEVPQREITEKIIAAAIDVHRQLGPGLLESVYQQAMQIELRLRAIPFQAQVIVGLRYKGYELAAPLKLDLLVEQRVVV